MKGKTYNQLVIFNAIVEKGSINQAAKKLGIATPSVSQALKLLEDDLGFPLFQRSTRSIDLTEAGEELHKRTVQRLGDLEDAFNSVRELNNEPSGRLRITMPRFVYQFLIRPLYADFCRQYPSIELEISVSDEAIDIIEKGFDLGIRFGHRVNQNMVAKELSPPMKDALFVSPGYAKEHGIPKTIGDLRRHKLIQYRFISSNQIAPLVLTENKQSLTVDMPTAMIVNDTDLMVDAALKGLGIGRIVEPMVEEHLNRGDLLPVLKKYWSPYSGLFLYFPKNAQRAKRVRALIDFLSASASNRI
ncbi:LysR family transcriptional regulator [Vibrio alfacsensis]|uniref:LysR family transcriptional regulator n=1 Tax=Vibrio alfacsensis TaxID=1074311 RepID=UPI004069280D